MAVTDGYSRIVLWLKVSLPLAALAILSTLFFVAETLDPEAAIPFADVDVERILTQQGISKPKFGGVTGNGVAIALTADVIRPSEDPAQMNAEQLVAVLDLPGGGHIDIRSDIGFLNSTTKEATLQGGARLESSTGYVITTERILTSLEEARVTTDTEIHATGPGGEITAGEMELTRSKIDDSYLLVFKSGVRLIYNP
ncbi:LPS export ABC transporter periplasmic protein LptC [Rhodobacteraceae bacterium]|nr:LPS export ABC transporter periplasmic protein LptC [Paracoccaceae bacterium]